jgi:hypothetical protein
LTHEQLKEKYETYLNLLVKAHLLRAQDDLTVKRMIATLDQEFAEFAMSLCQVHMREHSYRTATAYFTPVEMPLCYECLRALRLSTPFNDIVRA